MNQLRHVRAAIVDRLRLALLRTIEVFEQKW